MICIDEYRYLVGTIGATLVVSGVIVTDHALDHNTTNPAGSLLFILGWMLVALSITNFTVDWKKLGATIFVVIAAITAQYGLTNNNINFIILGGILFVISWYLLAFVISYDETNKKIDWQKGKFAFIGATLILISMMILMNDRKHSIYYILRGVKGTRGLYSFGLPLFTLGWILIMLATSIQD